MNTTSLSDTELTAVLRAMQYWNDHWDFECSTLFGVEQEDLTAVVAEWPALQNCSSRVAALAALGSLRELLYGASSVQADRLPTLLGLSKSHADVLCEKVHALARDHIS